MIFSDPIIIYYCNVFFFGIYCIYFIAFFVIIIIDIGFGFFWFLHLFSFFGDFSVHKLKNKENAKWENVEKAKPRLVLISQSSQFANLSIINLFRTKLKPASPKFISSIFKTTLASFPFNILAYILFWVERNNTLIPVYAEPYKLVTL